ncbi:MAG: arginine repressor, partial [Ruminococcaceae bacterium]|nr:arginine repressor [Oscillospiraceae bacterium]
EKILELIVRYEIETQDELIEKLRLEGYDVTQATASRDIKELKLAKTQTNKGKYRYVKPISSDAASGADFNAAIAASIISVDVGENIVVVRTYPGMANAVATGIDAIRHSDILGSVAGDDTILIVTRTKDIAANICEQVKTMMRVI